MSFATTQHLHCGVETEMHFIFGNIAMALAGRIDSRIISISGREPNYSSYDDTKAANFHPSCIHHLILSIISDQHKKG